MENPRRNNNRRSRNRRPARGASGELQPTVPSCEEELLQKFTLANDIVAKWDDSAVEEAFSNAEQRLWAAINGLPCDVPLPDPDLYIDHIDWDSETESQLVPDSEPEPVVAPNVEAEPDPVGESLIPNETYTPTGWGDEDDNFNAQANSSSAPLVQNWGDSFDNGTVIGWPAYPNYTWNYGYGNGYMAWGSGWNNGWSWNFNNGMSYGTQAHVEPGMAEGEWGQWNDSNISMANNGGNGAIDNNEGNETIYCGMSNHHSAVTVSRTWNQ